MNFICELFANFVDGFESLLGLFSFFLLCLWPSSFPSASDNTQELVLASLDEWSGTTYVLWHATHGVSRLWLLFYQGGVSYVTRGLTRMNSGALHQRHIDHVRVSRDLSMYTRKLWEGECWMKAAKQAQKAKPEVWTRSIMAAV